MAKQLMIYDDIQPVTSDKHRNYSVNLTDHSFTSELTSIPLLATEIPLAAAEYPVIFSSPNEQGEHTPLAVVGVERGENLMLNANNALEARYIPAFIRRYPFVFAGVENGEKLTLCLDAKSKALVADGSKGNRLFDDKGEQTEFLQNILKFLQDYQYRAEMTKVFCKQLKELDLLEPMQANIEFRTNEDQNMSIKGFYTIKREKLKELTDEQALDLFKRDGLELIYAHLQSLDNLNHLVERKRNKLSAA
ncbi:SapC family protein [Gilvimarinus agarilyticus]|uniref:SapC family protein n=1 Tax=unclassified Gilvimarinus TaxID=2642066 RepID=UPI001C09DBD8|nr:MULTISPECIES: SapC family protein [unclassified Gilvimarinus]MBU2885985.1 SapC family protein [Gilvimarinus agarilyticus]MDO6570731.1 SapC family protein [Gilvimarinus sp. 2_MG-2023]MDO6747676.1 SapC family protein [Gilvimarinus sp. 1_MG-2023]